MNNREWNRLAITGDGQYQTLGMVELGYRVWLARCTEEHSPTAAGRHRCPRYPEMCATCVLALHNS